MLNKSILIGRLVHDPELKHTKKGTACTSFALAVERNYSRQGEERQADFIDCEAWRQTAEFICKHFAKGQMIALSGSIVTGGYTDRDGNKRKTFGVKVEEVSFCGSKPENKPAGDPAPVTAQEGYSSGSEDDFQESFLDEDLPF